MYVHLQMIFKRKPTLPPLGDFLNISFVTRHFSCKILNLKFSHKSFDTVYFSIRSVAVAQNLQMVSPTEKEVSRLWL